MQFLIIGDLHYGKEFSTYQRNKHIDPKIYQQKTWFLKTDECLRANITVVGEYVKKIKDVIKVIFVGDAIDAPMLEPDIPNYFKNVIDYCIFTFEDYLNSVDVVIGTHDCLTYGDSGTFLSLLDGYHNIVNVYSKPTVTNLTTDSAILYLPYRDSKNFVDFFDKEDLDRLRNIKKLLIFSHNNFCFEYAGNIPLMSILDFNDNLKIQPEFEIVFNGHIHNSYIKKNKNINFIQVGSVSPLAFDGNIFRDGGICLYQIDEELVEYKEDTDVLLKNEGVAFFKIDEENTIDKLKELLKNTYTTFFIKYEAGIKDLVDELCKEHENILYICKYVKEMEPVVESEQEKNVKDDISAQINIRHEKNVDICELFDKYLTEKYGFNMTSI